MTRFIVALVGGLSLGGTLALISLGMVLAYRATSTFNFAHGQFMLIPAYIVGAWQASKSAPLAVSLAVSLTLVAVLAAVFYLAVLQRTTGLQHFLGAIGTLGLSIVLDGAVLYVFASAQYSITIPGLPTGVVEIFGARVASLGLFLAAFTLVLVGMVAAGLRYTQIGRQTRAAGQDPILASQGGINVRVIHMGSWALAGILAGLAGVAYGANNLVEPSMVHFGLAAAPALVIGGLDSVPGAIAGGMIVGVFQAFVASFFSPELLDMTTYTLLLIVMLIFPAGLFGTRKMTRV